MNKVDLLLAILEKGRALVTHGKDENNRSWICIRSHAGEDYVNIVFYDDELESIILP